MPGDVDDVVDTAEDPEVAVSGLNGAVAGEVRPVLPLLPIFVLGVFCLISLHETGGNLPDRLHYSPPLISDSDVARLGALRNFFAVFIEDDRMNAGDAWAGAAGLHRIERRLR